jgi:metal-sulfur cluster biosynthetic enzyme
MDLAAMFQPQGLNPTATPEEFVTDLLHDVIDPELGLNIVDLGLLRRVTVEPDEGQVDIAMTLTSSACPLGPVIEDDIHTTLSQVHWIERVAVQLVWEPGWDPDRDMSDAAKKMMGWA